LKTDVKAKVAVYAAAIQQQNESGAAFIDIYGDTIAPTNPEVAPTENNVTVRLT
jgi:hypothetical protein